MGFLLDGLENGLADELVAGLCSSITVGEYTTRKAKLTRFCEPLAAT
jgi:hypothetical protein